MKRLLPLIFITAVVCIFFRQFFLQHLLPIPADTIVGLYNPYRDLFAKDYPRGIPFKNFLITDPVRQQYPWRYESIIQEKKLNLPLWNPYNFAGNPLLANQQSAVFQPLNILFFVLPFSLSWSFLILLQPLLGGIFMYLYLRNLKLSIIPSLLGALAFAFSGFFVAWLEWGTVDMVAMFLPLELFLIDKVFLGNKKWKWAFFSLLTFSFAFFAGHAQTFFYIAIISTVYFFLHVMVNKQKVLHLLWGFGIAIAFLALTVVEWVPFVQFVALSARNSDLVMSAGWFIPWQHLITFLVPDFFGNPTTLNYWGVWNYAELAGYIGIPALLFAVFTFFEKMRKREWFFASTLMLALLFALPTSFAMLPLVLHIPFLSTAQPTRLLFIVDFSLCVLSAFGMQKFLTNKSKKIMIPIIVFLIFFGGIWFVALFAAKLFPNISLENILVIKHNIIFPTIIVFLSSFIIGGISLVKNKKILITVLTVFLLCVSVFDNLRFADKFTTFANQQYLFPQSATLQFLQKEIGIDRIMTTDSQILPPNFSLMYHLQSVDGYDPLYIRQYGELIASIERGKPDIHEPFGFNRILTPHNYQSSLINLLGVKYVLSFNDIQNKDFQKVFVEGQTKIYENKNVFPRAFFVKDVLLSTSDQQSVDFLFDPRNNLQASAIAVGISSTMKNLSQGSVKVISYSDNEVTIWTKNSGKGFLLFSDAFYPSWHVFIDGKENTIYRTDLAFRGVIVPEGEHTVKFKVRLF